MTEPARQDDVVLDMANYLEETIAEMDDAFAHWQAKRQELGIRLAVIRAAADPAVLSVVEDYQARVAEGRPYEGAEDFTHVLTEAHRRYGC